MSNKEIRIECLSEILEDIGLVATKEQIESLERDFSNHIEMEREMSFTPHFGHKDECHKCKILEEKIKSLEKDIGVYQNSVKIRRNASNVWIENDTVMFDK